MANAGLGIALVADWLVDADVPLRNTAWRGQAADDPMPDYPDPEDRLPQWRPDIWEGEQWLAPQEVPPYPVPGDNASRP